MAGKKKQVKKAPKKHPKKTVKAVKKPVVAKPITEPSPPAPALSGEILPPRRRARTAPTGGRRDRERNALPANAPVLSLNLQPQFTSRPGLRAGRRQATRRSGAHGRRNNAQEVFLISPIHCSYIVCRTRTGPIPIRFPAPRIAPHQPAFVVLAVDSLGKSKLSVSSLRPVPPSGDHYALSHTGLKFEYRLVGAPAVAPPAWTFECSARSLHLHSAYTEAKPPPALVLNFNPHINHATLLGMMNDDGSVRLPALLHLPDQGTFRITSSVGTGLALGYDAFRYPEGQQGDDYVKVTFPAASAARPRVDYTLEVVAIYPSVPELEQDPRFDGFRRNWLNIFQLNPRLRVLANHAASDPCAFTVFEYSVGGGAHAAPGAWPDGARPDPRHAGPLPRRHESLRHGGLCPQ